MASASDDEDMDDAASKLLAIKQQRKKHSRELVRIHVDDSSRGVNEFRSNKKTGRKGKGDIEKGTEWVIKEIVAGPRIVNMGQQFRVWWEQFEEGDPDGLSWEPIENLRGPALWRYFGWPERNYDQSPYSDHPRPPQYQQEWKMDSQVVDVKNPNPKFNRRLVPDEEEKEEDR